MTRSLSPRSFGRPAPCSASVRHILLLLVLTALQVMFGVSRVYPAIPEKEAEVSYDINVTLHPDRKTIEGSQFITWTNHTAYSTGHLLFHIYLNAYRNSLSTWVLEDVFQPLWPTAPPYPADYWGYTEVESIDLLSDDRIVSGGIQDYGYVQPDDGNENDQTVLRVNLRDEVPPGGRIRLRLAFVSKLPRGIGRTGWVEDYFFAAQWFPKLGVFKDGLWNCRQYHRYTEYYANFGSYRVKVTVPADFAVGSSGKTVSRSQQDDTATYEFAEDRIHDFAWVASPRFLEHRASFPQNRGPEVEIRVLLLPEHRDFAERYIDAARNTLHYMGEWFGPYPYDHLTIVDPAYRSDTGGMEYPALATGGTHFLSPPESLSPEGVTVHEVGHQWWYGVVASNEFEEAWLDEGINTWATARVLRAAYPQMLYMERFFGGIPVVFPGTRVPWETEELDAVRQFGSLARMTKPSWKLLDAGSYVANSYSKPAVTMFTLERLIGEDVLLRAMNVYFERFSFSHATTEDLIRTIEEVSGQDLGWFFDETFHSSGLVDYSVESVRSFPVLPAEGIVSDHDRYGGAALRSEIVVSRLGSARLPVDVLIRFSDGRDLREEWDGIERRRKYVYREDSSVEYAVVDPERKILLDVNPVNNSRWSGDRLQNGYDAAAVKWTSRWIFWLQNLLETFAFLG